MNAEGSSWTDVIKNVLQSQVGGWIMACLLFAIVAWWMSEDRATVYEDLRGLREKAMPLIIENNELLKEIRDDLKSKKGVDIDSSLPIGDPS